jgi:protein-S-isoprenylcysteine O-methyltransferase Ste14
MAKTASLPHSFAGWLDPLIIAGTVAALYALFRDAAVSDAGLGLIVALGVAAVMGGVEVFRAPWINRKPKPEEFRKLARRAGEKTAGVMLGIVALLLCWAVLPEYAQAQYRPFFGMMPAVLGLLPFVVFGFILLTEWRIGPARDAGWHLGQLALLRFKKLDWAQVKQAAFGWLVRGIFLPLNFSALASFIAQIRGREGDIFTAPWPEAENIIITMLMALLAAAIVPGYFFASRLLGTHIRRVDQSLLGWVVTLSCYPPLYNAVFLQWFNFTARADGTSASPWGELQASLPGLSAAAGGAILAFTLIHVWGEAIFGLRASNLSNRGIITTGPYRFTKHPVYVAKCAVWLMLWMPFVAGDTVFECLRLSILWACVCVIYALRAYVEEKLLSEDADYRDYALWIDTHGIFAALGRKFPALSFAWRLKRWK